MFKKYFRLSYFLAFLALSFFYWLLVRPSMIKKECSKIAMKSAISQYKNSNSFAKSEDKYYPDDYSQYYKQCLNSKGL